MNIVGASMGRVAIYDVEYLANINQAVCLIRLPKYLNHQFQLLFMNSEICLSYMFDKQVDNARANLSMGNISKFVIPVPPKKEQTRIVTKVNELMTLCDQLKTQLQTAQQTQTQLAQSIAQEALA